MPINVSQAICSSTAEKILVERNAPGGYVDGIYVPGATSSFFTLASVQQPSPKQLQVLPEGERDKDLMLFISKKKINTVSDRDSTEADVILRKGIRYKVIHSADWDAFGHTIVMGERIA